jgi:hypothetical protein
MTSILGSRPGIVCRDTNKSKEKIISLAELSAPCVGILMEIKAVSWTELQKKGLA